MARAVTLFPMSTYSLLLFLVIAPAFTVVTALAATEVTRCGQTIEGDGFLAADLDCSTFMESAVQMRMRGTLDLGGFTLTAGDTNGIACLRNCVITNGTVESAGQYGIKGFRAVTISDLTIRDCARAAHGKRLEATSLNSVNNRFGVSALSKTRVVDSSFVDNGKAVFGRRSVALTGTTISSAIPEDNSRGINSHRRVSVTNSTISGVMFALTAGKVRVLGSTISGNGYGVWSTGAMRLTDSTVLGNAVHPACASGSAGCVDLISVRKPRLRNSSCESSTSGTQPGGETWGVCSLD